MNEGLIARRYALAMFRAARKSGNAGEVYGKMKLFEQNYISHPDLHRALQNPVLSARDKEMLLTTAIGIEPGTLYVRGIRLLIRHHREAYVRSICLMYQRIYRQYYHINRIKIITAVPLPAETLQRIKTFMAERATGALEFAERVDPAILGGFILQVNSGQIDQSVSRELQQIKRELEQARR